MSMLVFIALLFGADPQQLQLTGRVLDQAGEPIFGASAFIYSGYERGSTLRCRSCYSTSPRSSQTSLDGRFDFPKVNPDLVFRLFIVAEGFQPRFVEDVDPLQPPVGVQLKPRDPKIHLKPRYYVRGRVLAPDGKPVVRAEVAPCFVDTNVYAGAEAVDVLTVTNERGEFMLTSKSAVKEISIKVRARQLAPRIFAQLTPGEPGHDLQMVEGTTVTGRVECDGKPVAEFMVGLVQLERVGSTFVGDSKIATDGEGRFRFSHVAPRVKYTLYGVIDTVKSIGCISAAELTTGEDGSTTDVGTLQVLPGHRLAGRVALADGKALPRRSRLSVSGQRAWDVRIFEIAPDGRFLIAGLPSDEYTVTGLIAGYHLSNKNASLDPLDRLRLRGRVDTDIDNLTILYDLGDHKHVSQNGEQYLRAAEKFKAVRHLPITGVQP